MQINPDEITSILKSRIEGLDSGTAELTEVGTVLSVADGIARLHGLENCMSFEMLDLPHGVTGLALNLESDNVGAVLFGDWEQVSEGDTVRRTGVLLEIPVGEQLLGRIVDPLGRPLDGKGAIAVEQTRPAEFKAPGVVQRQPVKQPMQTGLKAIDAMIPIGRGQRELIIGDRQTGKTAIAIDTIINNKDSDVVSVYVAIGQRMSTVVALAQTLDENGALDKTIIVAAPADEAAPIKFMAPYAGCAMAEHFLYNGKHALCVYDDLTKHAYAYRQMSLLLRRPPGREAYPGDVFYLHSRLLERAVKLNDELGGGSLTALPIIETQAGDVSAYIPTNVISITDGQIFLESKLFNSGVRPAINVGISVSRVGGNAQIGPMKKVAGRIKLELSQYRDLEAFAQFGSDLDADTQRTLARGERLVATLNQHEREPLAVEDQTVQIFAATNGFLDRLNVERVPEFLLGLTERLHSQHPELRAKINGGDWSDETQKEVRDTVEAFAQDFGFDLDEEGQPLEDVHGGLGPPDEISHGLTARCQEQDRLGEEHPEDHPGDGDGRRGAPAARRAAHRRPAPVRGGDRAHDAPGRPGRRRRGRAPAAADRAREREQRGAAARHRRPRPRRRLQLADHPGRRPDLRRAHRPEPEQHLVCDRPPRRLLAELPRLRAARQLHRLRRPARLRGRPHDRGRPDPVLHRRQHRPRGDGLQLLHLAADPAGHAPAAAPALPGGDRRRRERRPPTRARGRSWTTSPTPKRSSRGLSRTTSRYRSTGRWSSRPRASSEPR